MIAEATLALIMAVGSRPATQELGWVRFGAPVSAPLRRESTVGQILDPGKDWQATDAVFIHASEVAISRLDWIDTQIESYSALQVGWDGPDSKPPPPAHIEAARSILRLLPAGAPIPKPMLSSSGELGLYWEEPDWMADIAIEGDREFSLFFRSRDRQVEVLKSKLVVGPDSSAVIKETLTRA
jgi:hypothetical protein